MMPPTIRGRLSVILLAVALSACAVRAPAPPAPQPAPPSLPEKLPEETPPAAVVRFTPVPFEALPGYGSDDLAAGFRVFLGSCARIASLPAAYPLGGAGPVAARASDWLPSCKEAGAVDAKDAAAVRDFLKNRFTPFAISAGEKTDGLFTGYYEPEIEGCLDPAPDCATPVFARPSDLVMVELGEFRPELKGQRIAGSVRNGKLVPYPDRVAIEAGALKGRAAPLLYLKSPVDAFFLQIQGSGRVRLPDGTVRRVGYAAQNGHPYVAIGKAMKEAGLLAPPVTAPAIRAWLAAHPDEAAGWLGRNPSYVFFRSLDGLADAEGPVGSLGVPLTPGRSLAVDRTILPLGAPLWIATETPDPDGGDQAQARPFERLMVAEDTGGAIAGAVRGDIFFGRGAQAETLAGLMQGRGKLFILLPRGTCGDAPCAGTR